MKQDDDWTDEDGKLDKKLYYADQLHLVEAGNRKFACSILKILSKLMQDEKLCNSSDGRKAHYLFEFNSDVNRCKPVSDINLFPLNLFLLFVNLFLVNLFYLFVILFLVNLFRLFLNLLLVNLVLLFVNLFLVNMFHRFFPVMFIAVNLFLPVMFVIVNLFPPVMFVIVNLFLSVMLVLVNQFVPVHVIVQ